MYSYISEGEECALQHASVADVGADAASVVTQVMHSLHY